MICELKITIMFANIIENKKNAHVFSSNSPDENIIEKIFSISSQKKIPFTITNKKIKFKIA